MNSTEGTEKMNENYASDVPVGEFVGIPKIVEPKKEEKLPIRKKSNKKKRKQVKASRRKNR